MMGLPDFEMTASPNNSPAPDVRRNALGQPIGEVVPNWRPATRPKRAAIAGLSCRLEPLVLEPHARQLHEAYQLDTEGRNWTYLPYGPFARLEDYRAWVTANSASEDPMFFAIVDSATAKAVGVASYLRIDPANGVIEVGHLNFSPALQRRRAATEAMFLMMARAFDLGFRRYEWKCDALNAPSRQAAERLGFSFEGIFRQAIVVKGRNRDTAWYSITDQEWPALKAAYQRWLEPGNFDAQGRQLQSLSIPRPRSF
ncbi:MAG: Acetyltransferase [Verrucomicrobia bacterium]|nr:Acetyltransferase [Verrucomicrobiota bacterium]